MVFFKNTTNPKYDSIAGKQSEKVCGFQTSLVVCAAKIDRPIQTKKTELTDTNKT